MHVLSLRHDCGVWWTVGSGVPGLALVGAGEGWEIQTVSFSTEPVSVLGTECYWWYSWARRACSIQLSWHWRQVCSVGHRRSGALPGHG